MGLDNAPLTTTIRSLAQILKCLKCDLASHLVHDFVLNLERIGMSLCLGWPVSAVAISGIFRTVNTKLEPGRDKKCLNLLDLGQSKCRLLPCFCRFGQ